MFQYGENSHGPNTQIPYMWTLKRNDTNEFFIKKRNRLRDLEKQLMIVRGKEVREFGMDMYTVLYLKCVTNKDLLYSTWNSTQCFVAVWMGGEFAREWIHVYMYG